MRIVDFVLPVMIAAIPSLAHAAGPTFYVSTTGNDANSGTQAAPWQTISKAARTATPGSTVLVGGGTYRERVVITVSGNASAGPIVFRNAPGETPIINAPATPVASADGFPVGLIQIQDRSYVSVIGFEVTGYVGTSSQQFPTGIAIAGAGTEIVVQNNRVHRIYGNLSGKVGAHGIAVYGTRAPASLSKIVIDGNELYDLKLGQSEALVINGNVENWAVTRNHIHDVDNIGIDAIGFEKTSKNAAYDQARDGVIADNIVHGIDSDLNPAYAKSCDCADGIYVDGGTRITIERNVVYETNIGIELASERPGKRTSFIIARNNIVYNNFGAGFSLGGYSAQVGSTTQTQVINNTLFNNDTRRTGSGELQLQFFPGNSQVGGNRFVNNIVSPRSGGVAISTASNNSVIEIDNNFYDSVPTGYRWQWKKVYYTSLPAFISASGREANGLYAAAGFTDRTTPNLKPLPGSLGIGQGRSGLASGTTDAAGAARVQGSRIDVGAYEQ